MTRHRMDACREHGFIVTRCRCPGPHEQVTVECPPYCPGRIQDKGIDRLMAEAAAARVAAHAAELGRCAVSGCPATEVTVRLVPTDGTLRYRARVLLCDEHGGRQPTEDARRPTDGLGPPPWS